MNQVELPAPLDAYLGCEEEWREGMGPFERIIGSPPKDTFFFIFFTTLYSVFLKKGTSIAD